MTRKARVENVLVAANQAALAKDLNLYNSTTGVLEPTFTPGTIGIFAPDATYGWGNPISVDASTVINFPEVRILQRRDVSGDLLPRYTRTLEESGDITTACALKFNEKDFAESNTHAVLIGGADGTNTAAPIFDELNYRMQVSYNSRRHDWTSGMTTPTRLVEFFTPNYFNLGLADVDARDHLMQNIGYEALKYSAYFNSAGLRSDEAYWVLAIDSAGVGTGTALSTFVGAVPAVGSTITLATNPAVVTVEVTEEIQQTIQLAAAPIVAAFAGAKIVPIDLSTAGDGSANIDHLLFISIDPAQVSYDEVEATKVTMNIGLQGGFGSDTGVNVELVRPSEGEGYGREFELYYLGGAASRKYTGDRNWQANSVIFDSGINKAGKYNIKFIDYCEGRFASSGMPSVSPRRTVVGFDVTAGANAQETAFEATMNAWYTTFVGGTGPF